MRVFFDLDNEMMTIQAGVLQPVTEIVFKRAVNVSLEVQFARGGTIVELDPDATGIFGIKDTGQYDADYLVASLAWVKTGTGEDALYTFNFSLINTELNERFNVDADVTNDVETITAMAELQWVSGGVRHKSQTISVRVFNDVNRGGETVPDLPPGGYGIFLPNITSLTGGTPIDLDAVPTITLVPGLIIQLLITDFAVLQWMVFVLTTGSAVTSGDVQPIDHDDITNDKYWQGAVGIAGPPGTFATAPVVAAVDLAAFDIVTAGGAKANSATTAHCGHVVGITPFAVATGFVADLVTQGEVTNPAWSWTANSKLFLNGTSLSATPPTSGFVQVIALSRNSQAIIMQLGPPVRL